MDSLGFLRMMGHWMSEGLTRWLQERRQEKPLTIADLDRLCEMAVSHPVALMHGSDEPTFSFVRSVQGPEVERWIFENDGAENGLPASLMTESCDLLITMNQHHGLREIFMRWPGGSAEVKWLIGATQLNVFQMPMRDEAWDYFGSGLDTVGRSNEQLFVEALTLLLPYFVKRNLRRSKSRGWGSKTPLVDLDGE